MINLTEAQFKWEERMENINAVLETMSLPKNHSERKKYDPKEVVTGEIPENKVWDYHNELVHTPNEESIKSELIAQINRDVAAGKYDEFLEEYFS